MKLQNYNTTLYILLFMFLFPLYTFAGKITHKGAVDIFLKANNEYDAAQKEMAAKKEKEALEKFKNAARLYEQLLDYGFINGQIYYNLGNTYYRQGMPGKAVMYYRRAEILLPRNADIKANIKLLKSDFVDKEVSGQAPEFVKMLCFWYFFFNLNEIAAMTIYMYLALAASILAVIFLKFQWTKKLTIVFASCLFVLVVSVSIKAHFIYAVEKGVVVADECKVRYGPGEEYGPKFEIHEGAELKIKEERDGWCKVYVFVDIESGSEEEEKKDTESNIGWLPKAKIEKI